jgi:hypothetical protein
VPVHPFYSNWTAGVVTEKLASRTDFPKYQSAAKTIVNGVVLPQGGVATRAGTVRLGSAKIPDSRARLVPFMFSVDQSYMAELGVEYGRFWSNRARVLDPVDPVEVVTPYLEADLRELRFEQSADVLYIGHPDHPPAKITRVSATEFEYSAINFLPYPSYEPRIALSANLTLGSAAVGTTTVEASAGVFLAGDVGRQIFSGSGRAVITGFTDADTVSVRVLDAFAGTALASGDWSIDGSANAGTLAANITKPQWAQVTLTSSLDAFRSTDVGRYVYVGDGVAQITSVTNATTVVAQILRVLDEDAASISAAPAGTWTVESPAWSDTLGYPGVPCLHGGRLWWAGSPSFKDYVWASRSSDYENHARGPLDSDAIVQQLAVSGVNQIRWMKPSSQRGIAIGTIGAEMTIQGQTDEPLKPDNVDPAERTRFGSDYTVDAIKIDNQHIFMQRGASRVRELAYKYTEDQFASPDISILAEHLFTSPIVETAYVATPESLILALRADGRINLCTYERGQNVVAWSELDTPDGDIFESIAVIPNSCGTGDEVWCIAQRGRAVGDYWADGYWADDALDETSYWGTGYFTDSEATTVTRTIEVFDGGVSTDSGGVYAGAPETTFTGLDHLEARTVRIVVHESSITGQEDEYDVTVFEGAATLPDGAPPAISAEVGLPWPMTLVPVRPDVPTPSGTIQGRKMKWSGVTVRVYATRGDITLNGEVLQYPEEQDPVTTGEPFSGDMRAKTTFGWDRNGELTLQTTSSRPATITSLTGGLEYADA